MKQLPNKCPDCKANLRPGARACSCGFKIEASETKHQQDCIVCHRQGFYPSKNESAPPGGWRQGNAETVRIVGRDPHGMYICAACFRREPCWAHDAFKDFGTRHAEDNWGELFRRSRTIFSDDREQGSEFMAELKAQARGKGIAAPLPYDPNKREPGSYPTSSRVPRDEQDRGDAA